jgi:5-methylcytosine-specific restriction endonuclease McrA
MTAMTTERTLLLSPMYEPMTTISWRKAITLLTLGKVEVVEEYSGRSVRSTSIVFRLPSVVRLLNRFRRQRPHVRYSKQNVFARDRWTCQYCGQRRPVSELTVDHVVPRALGGKTAWDNVVTSCMACNSQKANRTPEQARMTLRARPHRPDWVPMMVLRLGGNAPDAWKIYCYFTE